MDDVSPTKWHLAHTTWFFDIFILKPLGKQVASPLFSRLFNSYYNAVGSQHPRGKRGFLSRPRLEEIYDYRNRVDDLILESEIEIHSSTELTRLFELGIQHEEQHQELMLMDIKHVLGTNPLYPRYGAPPWGEQKEDASSNPTGKQSNQEKWQRFDELNLQIGSNFESFAFDNEGPQHNRFIPSFKLYPMLVSNDNYLDFIRDGGYDNHRLWLSEGWSWVRLNEIDSPLYWQREHRDAEWQEYTLNGNAPLDLSAPVAHISYFEADAFATWAGARLPSEFELERAFQSNAKGDSEANPGTMLEQQQGFRWQWTQSSYQPYPGFRATPDAVGEYNGKFMVNQYVLKGSSTLTPPQHSRATYRNFFPTHSRWVMNGLRLAQD